MTMTPSEHTQMVHDEDYSSWLDSACEKIRKACVPDDILARNALWRIESKSQVRLLMVRHEGDTRAACRDLLVNLSTYQADDEDRRQADALFAKRKDIRDRFAVLAGKREDEDWGAFADRTTSTTHRRMCAELFAEAGGALSRNERKRKTMEERERQAEATATAWLS